MLPLGTSLPGFSLVNATTGELVESASLGGVPVLLTVICNHCPYVVRIKDALAELGRETAAQGVKMVAISSNDAVTYPADGPAAMKADAEKYGYTFPYLFDETQDLARALQAMCTPEFYLFDAAGQLTYRGRLDASSPGNQEPCDGKELRAAITALLSGAPPIEPQLPSRGCSIKWR